VRVCTVLVVGAGHRHAGVEDQGQGVADRGWDARALVHTQGRTSMRAVGRDDPLWRWWTVCPMTDTALP